jgi:hypothetical protein
MSHECPDCGQQCNCDMEDADMGNSDDCEHFLECGLDEDDSSDDVYGEA